MSRIISWQFVASLMLVKPNYIIFVIKKLELFDVLQM